MKIVITGGAGFIGSHIVDCFVREAHEVYVIDNLSHGDRKNVAERAKFIQMDIRDEGIEELFQKIGPDAVVHQAAQISVSKSLQDPLEDEKINIMGTLNLLEASRKAGVKKFVYPSTAAVFGEPQYLPIDEEHPTDMISNYGASKYAAEQYIKLYHRLYKMGYTIFRYSNVYGPRQDSTGEGGVISIFCEKMLKEERPSIFGDGKQTRDFVYVEDIARANLLAALSEQNGLYNLCTNTRISVNEVFEIIKKEIGFQDGPIYAGERKGDILHSYMSFEKMKKDFGWEPTCSFEKGISNTVDYYRRECGV